MGDKGDEIRGMHSISFEYQLGDMVYLEHDPEQAERMVTGINYRPTGIVYELSCGVVCTPHFAFEITVDRKVTA